MSALPDDVRAAYKEEIERLGVELSVLRIRTCRLRDALQTCVGRCVKRAA